MDVKCDRIETTKAVHRCINRKMGNRSPKAMSQTFAVFHENIRFTTRRLPLQQHLDNRVRT
jgi:hypothetical protein